MRAVRALGIGLRRVAVTHTVSGIGPVVGASRVVVCSRPGVAAASWSVVDRRGRAADAHREYEGSEADGDASSEGSRCELHEDDLPESVFTRRGPSAPRPAPAKHSVCHLH
jgi:hypothetical protein